MKILVTGATGLIGCHALARLVAAGHRVRALVRDPAKLARVLEPFPGAADGVDVRMGEVTDATAVASALAGCEGLLHCAGVFSHDLADADLLRRANVDGVKTVLGAAAASRLDPIVFISSMAALFPPAGPTMRADDPVTEPRAMYAATKAEAERFARRLQAEGAALTIVYPGSCHGPHDPTVGSGPGVIANALRDGRVLVTEGGLPFTDVRDLAALFVALFEAPSRPARVMAPSFFISHERYHALLTALTGRKIQAIRLSGPVLRLMGRLGDLGQRLLGRSTQLTAEAALVLTRSVPLDDAEARRMIGAAPVSDEKSFRDLLTWMYRAGVLRADQVGSLAGETGPGSAST
jgi:nucleoside-diphosphate-sugar epimerase